MRYRVICPTLIIAALAVAGCGSSSKSTSNAATSPNGAPPPGNTTSAAGQGRTYNLKLTSASEVPKVAASATASAVISIRSKTNQLCWKFSKLTGVTTPSAAHIHKGAAGSAGPIVIPLGGAYKASGCTAAAAPLLSQIKVNRSGFYVNIHNAKHPGGAVRAQL